MANGFAPIAREARTGSFAPTFLIAALDAARREAAQAAQAAEAGMTPEPDPVAAVIAEARRVAFLEGKAEGLHEAAASATTLGAQAAAQAATALAAGHAAAAAAARDAAEEVARLALAMLDAALPGLAAGHGGALAAGFAQRLRPMLEGAPEARLLVAPGFVDATRELLGDGIAIAEDAGLAAGDARAEWRSGGATLDLAARRQAIRGVLEAAGLGPRE